MLTLIFAIWASEPPPPRVWRTTEKAGPDRVKISQQIFVNIANKKPRDQCYSARLSLEWQKE